VPLPEQERGRTLRKATLAGEAIAGAGLIASTQFLPWVSYEVNGSPHPSQLHAGAGGILLVVIGGVIVALAAGQAMSPKRGLAFSCCALGAIGLILTVLSAATRMAHANSLTTSVGGSTSYGSGPFVAAVAAVIVVVTAATQLGRSPQTPHRA